MGIHTGSKGEVWAGDPHVEVSVNLNHLNVWSLRGVVWTGEGWGPRGGCHSIYTVPSNTRETVALVVSLCGTVPPYKG